MEQQKPSALQSSKMRSRLFTTAQKWSPKKTKHRSTVQSSHERNKKRKVQISRRETERPTNNVKKKKKKEWKLICSSSDYCRENGEDFCILGSISLLDIYIFSFNELFFFFLCFWCACKSTTELIRLEKPYISSNNLLWLSKQS